MVALTLSSINKTYLALNIARGNQVMCNHDTETPLLISQDISRTESNIQTTFRYVL